MLNTMIVKPLSRENIAIYHYFLINPQNDSNNNKMHMLKMRKINANTCFMFATLPHCLLE